MYRKTFTDPPSPISPHGHLVHASDADQAHALLARWGPDGQGRVGGPFQKPFGRASPSPLTVDPRWANPIKNTTQQNTQAGTVNEAAIALKPSTTSRQEVAQLRVITGITAPTPSTIATAARENVSLTPVDGFPNSSVTPQSAGRVVCTLTWSVTWRITQP